MTNKIGALFDLDGVLIDTEGIYTEFWHGIDCLFPTGVENFEYVIKGNTLDAILSKYYPDKDIQAKIVELLDEHQSTMKYAYFDGVEQFLDILLADGIPMAVVTSSDHRKMESLYKSLPGFKTRFDAIITAADVTRSKPDPQGYLLGARAIGMEPSRCVVFEDSFSGLRAGRNAGAKVVGIATTQAFELVAELADITVNTLAEITLKQIKDLF